MVYSHASALQEKDRREEQERREREAASSFFGASGLFSRLREAWESPSAPSTDDKVTKIKVESLGEDPASLEQNSVTTNGAGTGIDIGEVELPPPDHTTDSNETSNGSELEAKGGPEEDPNTYDPAKEMRNHTPTTITNNEEGDGGEGEGEGAGEGEDCIDNSSSV